MTKAEFFDTSYTGSPISATVDIGDESITSGKERPQQNNVVDQLQNADRILENPDSDSSEDSRKVFINAAVESKELATKIANFLKTKNIDCSLPLDFSKSSNEIGKELEAKLQESKAMVILFKEGVPKEWVQSQIALCRRNLARLNRSVKIVIYSEGENWKYPMRDVSIVDTPDKLIIAIS
jgi:hypothetical protein